MLLAYCDASFKDNKAVATTLITTEDTFITCFSKTYTDVSSSVKAELLGVLQTMEYINNNCTKEKQVALFTDSRTIAVKYISMLSKWEVPPNEKEYEIYKKLLQYSASFNVNIQHIRGHQHTHNPNKVCDILSKVYCEGVVE